MTLAPWMVFLLVMNSLPGIGGAAYLYFEEFEHADDDEERAVLARRILGVFLFGALGVIAYFGVGIVKAALWRKPKPAAPPEARVVSR